MVLPPWDLWAPSGAIHRAIDEAQLKATAVSSTGIDNIPNKQLRLLVGAGSGQAAKMPLASLSQHRCGWQLRARVRWLRNIRTGELIPVLGGEAAIFMRHHGQYHDDLCHAEQSRLNEFVGKGWYD